MKSSAKSKIIILTTLGILFALSPIITTNLSFFMANSNKSSEYSDDISLDNDSLKLAKISGKIHIDNNWSAAEAAEICTGNGTYSEPYVIEDLVIDGGGSGSCIEIENSDVFFKIENCTVYNSGGNSSDAGIRLSYVNNSQFNNNNCSSNYNGICLSDSHYNNISGNVANNNDYGIRLSSSNYNNISGNTVNNNWNGIRIFNCLNNSISGNTLNSNDNSGILLSISHYNTVSGNNASYTSWVGINLWNSDNNTITGNTANYNEIGINLWRSDNNTITGNTLLGNDKCIMEGDCEGNEFSDNGDCTYGQGNGGIPIEMIILISGISGAAVIGVATLLLIRRRRKRMVSIVTC